MYVWNPCPQVRQRDAFQEGCWIAQCPQRDTFIAMHGLF
jgi:hypothetical protein